MDRVSSSVSRVLRTSVRRLYRKLDGLINHLDSIVRCRNSYSFAKISEMAKDTNFNKFEKQEKVYQRHHRKMIENFET